MEILVPNELIFTPEEKDLPLGWNYIPSISASQKYGSDLLKSGNVCFTVPSVVDSSSLNYVINPLSEQFSQLEFKVYSLELDKRIVR